MESEEDSVETLGLVNLLLCLLDQGRGDFSEGWISDCALESVPPPPI